MAEDKEPERTVQEPLVLTKYKMAADIVNRILGLVLQKCVAGASVREICEYGDNLITEDTSKVFKKEKEMKKGIAFPTCVSINNCICHFSPLPSEADHMLKEGELAKIDLGAHIDGFIAVVAHSIIVSKPVENEEAEKKKVTGRQADVLKAAYLASEVALRLLKSGNETGAVTDAVNKVATAFKCKPVEGMLSHQLKQFKIDGEKTIIQNPTAAQKKEHEKFKFDLHEVYAMDVLVSTGEGVGRESEKRVTVYKKTEETYQLKLKTARMFYIEVKHKHGAMPFNLRSFENEVKARMGIVECINHKVIEPFPVLYEKPGELVAHFKFTVLLLPSGPLRITGLPVDVDQFETENAVTDPELLALLNLASRKTNKKKKKTKPAPEKPVETEASAE
ncbi:proliferation-associated protein 2G4 [Arctopsyche grandis]|uniref:proliferation-associated protein 2G4 n=1 Tax=Arctopsyche grandis TaxID=121162 RepID=UPI00406D6379